MLDVRHDDLTAVARKIRFAVVRMSHRARAAHLGSSLSCVDILTALYWTALNVDTGRPDWAQRDRFILSKGHAAASLYATLALKGFFSEKTLADYGQAGKNMPEHPAPFCMPGVEVATGSLGHGLPIGAGMALAANIQKSPHRVFLLMSDGECNEGAVWEAAMFAASHSLENLIVFVDFNKWQATGRSCDVMALDPLAEKWRAFGWSVNEIDGHDLPAIIKVLERVPDGSGRPIVCIANTVKGKGISFMEDDNNWHYRIPTEQEVEAAGIELGER